MGGKWEMVKITECARIVSGATPDTENTDFWNGAINWVTPKDISDLDGKFITETSRKLSESGLKSCSAEVLPVGSVLFSSRAPIGLVAINRMPVATNQGFKSFIPDHHILNAEYLYFWLKANRRYIEYLGVGATFKEVNKRTVEGISIPLPPLTEQKRIAAILDAADSIRAKRKAAIAKLDELAQSVFLEIFGDPIRNEKGWEDAIPLGDMTDIVSGITKGRIAKNASMKEVPYLAVSNVQDRHLILDVVKTIMATDEEIKRYKLEENDLLLTEGGDPDKLGRGTLWNNEIMNCIHQNHIFRVRVKDKDKLNPLFLEWLIGSTRGKKYFLKSAKQTTGIASINLTQLKRFPLLLPPYDRQLAFESRIIKIEVLKSRHQSALAREEALFASLQHRAFAGEL